MGSIKWIDIIVVGVAYLWWLWVALGVAAWLIWGR